MIFVGFVYPDNHLSSGVGACHRRGAWLWCELTAKASENSALELSGISWICICYRLGSVAGS